MNSVNDVLSSIENDRRRNDSEQLITIVRTVTSEEPTLWYGGIIGFGTYHYVYESGREGDTPIVGFAPRKNAIVIYGLVLDDHQADQVKKLGPVTMGKGCIYIKDLSKVDHVLLRDMITAAFARRSTVS
ncbi:MAG TPA: DUF1801 domain-containing protein [Candidatus Saccharimonadales bacterium]